MNKFRFDKLVRDRIADKIRAEGHSVDSRVLSPEENIEALFGKFEEEVGELKVAVSSEDRGEIIAEMADVMTVVRSLAGALEIKEDELEEKIVAKTKKSGAFDQGVYIEAVELNPKGESYDYWLKNFRDDPDRYQEV